VLMLPAALQVLAPAPHSSVTGSNRDAPPPKMGRASVRS
jgi:hypothetical protein